MFGSAGRQRRGLWAGAQLRVVDKQSSWEGLSCLSGFGVSMAATKVSLGCMVSR